MKKTRRERRLQREKLKAEKAIARRKERECSLDAAPSATPAPPAPESGTRFVANEQPCDDDTVVFMAIEPHDQCEARRYMTRPDLARAKRWDQDRVLDWRICHLLCQGAISREAVEALLYCVTLNDFLSSRTSRWAPNEKRELRFLRGHSLWDEAFRPTEFGEELWALFRRRNRREGAIDNILDRSIRRPTLRRVA